ncbi:hypothetical protein THICB1_80115 [Thiomonas arsenitoxydans]|uniref:Uncharacterized protein n=1 Tax=Thiomonas arsenitoxydans (strain DSM 22701 / CIP 110005 / 3As) TaxID=426114 RepID=A0ABM9T9G6_THIA3|nr:hypothetical protein ACO7_490049 [Thiomonas arsenitoxydans]CQR36406.1 hypothetical protein ACO3_490049 [Thiomonas arsenitoxydans]CQR37516.1 hypothetical protein THICB6_40122 [Thiomonas arsenitoxydans]CQR39006.1 hypothetical protein THICB1_80115 [Thiomonas arsenitoxydans]
MFAAQAPSRRAAIEAAAMRQRLNRELRINMLDLCNVGERMKTTELWMGSVGGSSPHLIGFVVSLPVKYLTSASGITGIPLEWAHCAERGANPSSCLSRPNAGD